MSQPRAEGPRQFPTNSPMLDGALFISLKRRATALDAIADLFCRSHRAIGNVVPMELTVARRH